MDTAECELCHINDERPLVNPKNTGCSSRDFNPSLKKLANILTEYREYDCLPETFNMSLFEFIGFESFEDKLQKMNIRYHKTCRDKYSDTKLQKLIKKKREEKAKAKTVQTLYRYKP